MLDKRIIILLVSIVLFEFSAKSFTTQITGCDKAYASTEVAFYKVSDPIIKNDKLLAKTIVDSAGRFTLSLELSQTTYIYSYLGAYKCFLYVEPNGSYELLLPPKSVVSEADKLNPYFSYAPVHLVTKNMTESDINFLIRSFDDAWIPYYNRFAQNIYSRNSRNMIDTAMASLNKPYINNKNEYFAIYKDYKIGMLRHMAYQQKSKAVWKQYFFQKSIQYDNPGYSELFNQVFDKYFVYFSQSPQGSELSMAIDGRKSLWYLKKVLNGDSILQNDTLKELVILKNLHDEFYKANHSRSAMLVVLDSLIATSPIAYHRSMAEEIRNKVTRLMVGFEPPAFELSDITGKTYKLSDFKGKYLYLCFCSCNSYSCLKEFDALQTIFTTHKEKLNIVTILTDTDTSEIKNFITKSGFKWLFLTTHNQPDLLKKYDIRAFPTYYFVDKDGRLLFSPSPSPSEQFETRWFECLRSRKEL